jgi:hypothetical protein
MIAAFINHLKPVEKRVYMKTIHIADDLRISLNDHQKLLLEKVIRRRFGKYADKYRPDFILATRSTCDIWGRHIYLKDVLYRNRKIGEIREDWMDGKYPKKMFVFIPIPTPKLSCV